MFLKNFIKKELYNLLKIDAQDHPVLKEELKIIEMINESDPYTYEFNEDNYIFWEIF